MMPNFPQTTNNLQRSVEVLAFDDVLLLDLAGVTQVFTAANELAIKAGKNPPYQVEVVAPEGTAVRSTSGITIATNPLSNPDDALDTLIVVGGQGVRQAAGNPEVLGWLKTRSAATRRVASVCTGAFLLAAAGLLDGRRAATRR